MAASLAQKMQSLDLAGCWELLPFYCWEGRYVRWSSTWAMVQALSRPPPKVVGAVDDVVVSAAAAAYAAVVAQWLEHCGGAGCEPSAGRN